MMPGLLHVMTYDGSRQFFALPENVGWASMRDHIARLQGAQVTGFLSDGVTEAWIDFTFGGYTFAVNNQLGEYWFFVEDPTCPDEVLQSIADHCASIH